MPLAYSSALGLTVLASGASAAWLSCFAGAPAGGRRLRAAVPVLALNVALPLLFDRSDAFVSATITAFLVTWLSSFKALAWAGGRGSLSALPPGASRLQFMAVYCLPLVLSEAPKQGRPAAPEGGAKGAEEAAASVAVRWAVKTALVAGCVFWLQQNPSSQAYKELLYVFGLYGMLGFILDGPAAVVFGRLGLALEPHFRPPWEAASVSQFWGRQWNLAASNSLRTTIYEPVLEGSLVRSRAAKCQRRVPPAEARSARAALALCCACFASGVVHEVIMWYPYRRTTGGVWLFFFTLQGPLIVAERWALHALASAGVKVPRYARVAATLSLLFTLGHYYFWAPAEELGMTTDFAGAMRRNFAAVAGTVLGHK